MVTSRRRKILIIYRPAILYVLWYPLKLMESLSRVLFGITVNEERYRFNINAIHAIKDNHNVRSFECSYEDSDKLRTVLLKYVISEHRWIVG